MRYVSALLALCLIAIASNGQAAVEEVRATNATAWLAPSHDVPVFTLKLAFKESGTAYDPKDKEGLATLMTESLTEGGFGYKDSMTGQAFHEALERKAIRLSIGTSEDTVYVTLESLSQYRNDALNLLSLMLTQPRFDADTVARVKKEMQAAIRQRQENPDSIADDAWHALAWPNHPYGRPGPGTETSVEKITAADVAGFYKSTITMDHLLVAAAGDITAAQLIPFLDGIASKNGSRGLQAVSDRLSPAIREISVATSGQQTIARDIPQSVVMFGFEGVKRNDPRYYAAFILNHLLGGGELDTRLMVNLRGKEGLVYYAYTSLDDMDYAQAWRGAFAATGDKVERAKQILRQSFKDLAEKGVTQEDLDAAKRFLTGSFPLKISSNGALANYLISMQYYHLGIDYLTQRNGYINAVTLAQVNALAEDLLAKKTPVMVTVGTKK